MRNITGAFQAASQEEMQRFNKLVEVVIELNEGVNPLDLSTGFNEFLTYKEPKGAVSEDFKEYLMLHNLEFEPVLAMAA